MRCKVSEVMYIGATRKPVASCSACGWDNKFIGGSAKAAARQHVAATGHNVLVVKEEITSYYPPNTMEKK